MIQGPDSVKPCSTHCAKWTLGLPSGSPLGKAKTEEQQQEQQHMNNHSPFLAIARKTMAILASVWLCLAGVAQAKHHNDISFTPKITDVSVVAG